VSGVTTACIYVSGSRRYGEIAREAALSLLDHSPFDLFFVHDPDLGAWAPRARRVHALPLPRPRSADRAAPFNRKLDALALCLERSGAARFLLLDADAVLMRPIGEAEVHAALGGRGMAMTEQKRIVGTGLDRRALYEHYCRVSLRFHAPGLAPPGFDDFRYFNSGVVLLERETARTALDWTLARVREAPGPQRVDEEMVADQDHLQVWTNSIRPGCCTELPWYWNHCEHWDEDFPRPDAWIAHFSNFCAGPAPATARRMRRLRRRGLRTGVLAHCRKLLR